MNSGNSFIFLLVDNSTGQVVSGYHAPDPVWANNGPTCIHPEYKRNGKGYRTKKIVDKSKAFAKPSTWLIMPCIPWVKRSAFNFNIYNYI